MTRRRRVYRFNCTICGHEWPTENGGDYCPACGNGTGIVTRTYNTYLHEEDNLGEGGCSEWITESDYDIYGM